MVFETVGGIVRSIMNATSSFFDSSSLDLISTTIDTVLEDPETLFKCLMGTLVATGITAKAWPYLKSNTISIGSSSSSNSSSNSKDKKPPEILSLQQRFLPVFFLYRMSFWMSGPYFYQVYSSKILSYNDGTTTPATKEFVARVSLVGYLAIVILGPITGRWTDKYGQKTATICAGIMYAIGSLSVFSNNPMLLYLGRAVGSVASSRLCSTPESWLIGEYLRIQKQRRNDKKEEDHKYKEGKDCWLSETFGLAYGGDALVAILAGQTASLAASRTGGPTGPFLLSPLFIAAALLLTILCWVETKEGESGKSGVIGGGKSGDDDDKKVPPTDCPKKSGIKVIFSDSKIFLIGLVQSLFEGSMYIFVLVWPPAISNSIQRFFGPTAATPFGTVFSCLMACCLLGSVLFGQLRKRSVDAKSIMTAMLFTSTIAFSGSVYAIQTENLFAIIVAFFVFEVCVGMYFPSIGTIRSKLIPESHRSVIMTLFAVPLNALVVGVVFFHSTLGDIGALTIASFAMGIATACMIFLRWKLSEEEHQRHLKAIKHWNQLKIAMRFVEYQRMNACKIEKKALTMQRHRRHHSAWNKGAFC